jgi:hypothetical protein
MLRYPHQANLFCSGSATGEIFQMNPALTVDLDPVSLLALVVAAELGRGGCVRGHGAGGPEGCLCLIQSGEGEKKKRMKRDDIVEVVVVDVRGSPKVKATK